MLRLTTRSGWASFRDALADLTPFDTYGALRGDRGVSGTGRLPESHATEYRARREFVDYTVTSYATPIAWHDTERGWICPDVQYSRTTSGHQSRIRTAVNALNE